MNTLFSVAFAAIFLAFVAAAIVGHVLLIEALVRPFLRNMALANTRAVATTTLLAQPGL